MTGKKSPIHRWRRIQLARFLGDDGFAPDRFDFDSRGNKTRIHGIDSVDEDLVEKAIGTGIPFMTNGCPGPEGEPGAPDRLAPIIRRPSRFGISRGFPQKAT